MGGGVFRRNKAERPPPPPRGHTTTPPREHCSMFIERYGEKKDKELGDGGISRICPR